MMERVERNARIKIAKISSMISMPKINCAKSSCLMLESLRIFTIIVVDEIESMAPRKSESKDDHPNKRPIPYPVAIMNTISSKAVTNAATPTFLNLSRLNSRPSENIKKMTPSSANVLMVCSSEIKEKGGV